MTENEPRELVDFLHKVTGINESDDGYIEVVSQYKHSNFFTRMQMSACINTIESIAQHKHECHFGPALRMKNQRSGRSNLNNILSVRCIWIDIDATDSRLPLDKQNEDTKRLLTDFLSALDKYHIQPSYVVSTGHGYHVYFILKEVHSKESSEWKRTLLALTKMAKSDPRVKDITRLMRVPFTLNVKNRQMPLPVMIINKTDAIYNITDFENIVKEYGGEQFSKGTSPQDIEFYNDIFEQDNKYCRIVKGDNDRNRLVTLSNFTIDPVERIIEAKSKNEFIIANFINENDMVVKNVHLSSTIWTNKKDFLEVLPGISFTYTGNEKDIQLIKNIISKNNIPLKVGYSTIGFHRHNDKWLFLSEEGAINNDGIVDEIIYMGNVNDFKSPILNTAAMSKDELVQCAEYLSTFNDIDVVAPLIGWIVAAPFKARLYDIGVKGFPILSISGEAGSGKTETIRSVLLAFYGTTLSEKSIPSMTPFTLMLLSSATNCYPLCLDEYKPNRLNEFKKQMISEYNRSNYNSLRGDRGRPDLTKVEYQYLAPTIIAGEDRIIEIAARERILEALFVKSESMKHSVAFNKLRSFNILGLGRLVIQKELELSGDEIRTIFETEWQQVSADFKGRYKTNVAVGRFGLKILDIIMNEVTGYSSPLKVEMLEVSQSENLLCGLEKENIADRIISRMLLLINENINNDKISSQYQLIVNNHYCIKGEEIRIHLESVYPIFLRWSKDYPAEIDLISKEGFLQQVKHQPYFKAYKPAQIFAATNKTKLCLILNLPAVREKGIEIFEFMASEEYMARHGVNNQATEKTISQQVDEKFNNN